MSAAEPDVARGVLFDLDGTLVDTIGLIVASFQHAVMAVAGEAVDEATARSWIGRPLLPVLLERSPTHGEEMDRVYREWNRANTERLIRPYAGIAELLADLAADGVPMGIVTSKRREIAQYALDSVGLGSAIALLGTLEDTSEHKPDPAPLLLGAKRLGVEPRDCTYVGDATVDVLAARAAGMRSIAVSWGAGTIADLEATTPDLVVGSVGELAAYLLAR